MSKKLKPRLYLQVEDEQHMNLFYSVLSEDTIITPKEGSLQKSGSAASGEITYSMEFTEAQGGPSHYDGVISGIEVTKSPDVKITFIAIKSGLTPANDDGQGTTHSEDGDDK